MHRVKFYSKSDWASGHNLQRAKVVIDKFDESFVDIYQKVNNHYKDNFFEIIEKHKIYEQISEKQFNRLLGLKNLHLYYVLRNRKTTEYFGNIIRERLCEHWKYAELILDKYEIEHSFNKPVTYFPKQFTNKDKEKIIKNYVKSPYANLNYLRIIENIQNSNDLEISDKTKLETKKRIEDYPEYDRKTLDFLLESGHIKISDNGYIKISNIKAMNIMKDLNDNQVVSYWKYPSKYRNEMDILVEQEILKFENTLFSKPEQDYFNYYLNKSEFNNSLDLRNKYSHGTQPDTNNKEIHYRNYIIFLKLFILIIIKINDELCFDDDKKALEND